MRNSPKCEVRWYLVSWHENEVALGYYRAEPNHPLAQISQATTWGVGICKDFFDEVGRDDITVVPCYALIDCGLEKSIDVYNATAEENAVLIRLGLLINVGTKDEGYLASPCEVE